MDSLSRPRVSVVIPAYNEQESISNCLNALKSQDYPASLYSIVVVDNGSSDGTVSVVKSCGVEVLSFPNGKVGAVRNYGAKSTSGEVIAFIDADCIPGKSWISSAVEALSYSDVGAVGGYCMLPDNSNWVQKAWVLGERPGNKEVKSLAGSSFILKRAMFDKFGGFDESINAGEDTKLTVTISESGYRLLKLEACDVVHLGYPDSIVGFMKRQFWQSSSYLKSNSGVKDKVFWATLIFLVSFVSMIFSFSLFNINVQALFFAICFSVVSAFTFNRFFFWRIF